MKIRVISLLLLLAMLCVSLCSCEILKLVNNILPFFHPEGGDNSTNVSLNFNIPDPNRCTNHAAKAFDTIEPSCNEPGWKGGQYCINCGVVIIPQKETSPAHKYDNVYDKDCNECGFVREVQCNHLEVKILEETPSTCVTNGYTKGEQCVTCGKILNGYEEKEVADHTYDDADDDSCNVCGFVRKLTCPHELQNKLPAVEPTCESVGLTQGWSCGHCGEILLAQKEIPTIAHTESDWIIDIAPTETNEGAMYTECTTCHTVLRTAIVDVIVPEDPSTVSQGLTFALNEDKNSYTLVDIGKCDDVEIVIPRYYNGKLVTKIGDGAFLENGKIISVVIPEGVLAIGNGAFKDCAGLERVVLPSTITKIGEYAFYDCALTSLNLPSKLTTIEKYSFYGCDFTKIEIPYGVVSIGEGAFAECTLVDEILLSFTIETIGKQAFYNITEVTSIVIPTTVRTIGDKAFNVAGSVQIERTYKMGRYVTKIGAYAFTTGADIIYAGTSAEWNSILIDPRNYQYNITTSDGSFVD